MRLLTLTLVAFLVLVQYPLWLGKGSWLRVWEMDRKLQAQTEVNRRLRARNAAMDAEVRDLKQGYDAIEERARAELGMIKEDEIFFQVIEPEAAVSLRKPEATIAPALPPKKSPDPNRSENKQ